MRITKRIVLHFPPTVVDQPIIYKLIKEYNLVFNILKANITPDQVGVMVMELSGEKEDYKKGIEYLVDLGVEIQPLSQDIKWVEKKCTHCGVCVGICPTGALHLDPNTRLVSFDENKCVACEICVKPCPTRAIEVHF